MNSVQDIEMPPPPPPKKDGKKSKLHNYPLIPFSPEGNKKILFELVDLVQLELWMSKPQESVSISDVMKVFVPYMTDEYPTQFWRYLVIGQNALIHFSKPKIYKKYKFNLQKKDNSGDCSFRDLMAFLVWECVKISLVYNPKIEKRLHAKMRVIQLIYNKINEFELMVTLPENKQIFGYYAKTALSGYLTLAFCPKLSKTLITDNEDFFEFAKGSTVGFQ